MTEQLGYLQDLIKSCQLTRLNYDLDSIPLEEGHFQDYHKMLEKNLPILYDVVQTNMKWIFEDSDTEAKEVQASLLVLLCELTAESEAPYRFHNEYLLRNAQQLLDKTQALDKRVEALVFEYYEEKLQKDEWKRQIAAAHGYLRFLKWRFSMAADKEIKMSQKWFSFSLAIGLRFRESHEPHYKQMGNKIFILMLEKGDKTDVKEMNVHAVIYDALLHDVSYMDSVEGTRDIWSCLCKCLDFYNLDSAHWSQVDDMLEELTKYIPLAPNSSISCCMLEFVTQLCCYFAYNKQEIHSTFASFDPSNTDALHLCHKVCSNNNSSTIYRWAKQLLELFIFESHKLKEGKQICQQLLQELLHCFMVVVLPMPSPTVFPHLKDFIDKFVPILMDLLKTYENDETIPKLVTAFLLTMRVKVDENPLDEVYQGALNLLQNHIENKA